MNLTNLLNFEFLKYFFVSILGLAVDILTFSLCLRIFYFSWFVSASVSFFIGMSVVYFLSINFIFSKRKMKDKPISEFLIFFTIGILGLTVTQLSLYMGIEILDINPEISKLTASIFTFLFNYFLRKNALFKIK